MDSRGKWKVGWAGALVLALGGVAGAAVTGNIEGTVTDKATGKPLAGVTAIVTGTQLQGEQAELTDNNGHYLITQLPPGEYTVRFYYSDVVVERGGIVLAADRTLRVSASMPTQDAQQTTYTIQERAPSVDVGSAQMQTQVSKEVVRNTPVAGGLENRRSYDSVLALVPTASFDVNPTFSGATGNENMFLLDGLNTTQVQKGFLGTQLSLEFVHETDVVTAGYNAEYGRSTGAVVNVVTNSGSNEFHGGAWFYVSPYQLTPPAVEGFYEAVANTSTRAYTTDFGVDLGGPVLKDKLWFYVGFAPTYNEYTDVTTYRRRLAAGLPATQTSGTYAGDTTTATHACPAYMSSRMLCPSVGDTGYLTEEIPGSAREYSSSTNLYNWIAKLDYRPLSNHNLSLSYVGSPTATGGTSGGSGPPSTRQSDELNDIQDVVAHLVSKLFDHRLQLDLVGGWHYETDEYTYPTAEGNGARISYSGTMPLSTFERVPECDVQTIHGVTFSPCPVSGWTMGGAGAPYYPPLEAHRFAGSAGATYLLQRAGTHQIKLGFDAEDDIFESRPYFTGGAAYRMNAAGDVFRRVYAHVLPDGGVEELPNGSKASVSTMYEALYLRDSWNLSFLPDLTLNVGLRWEGAQLHGADGTTVISINDSLAPRAGLAYDFSRRGLARFYANYGRYYEAVPMQLNDSQFASHSITRFMQANPGTCQRNAQGLVDIGTCQFPALMPSDVVVKGYPNVQPDLGGQYINEVVAGTQVDVGYDFVLGAAYVHRDLGRVIEDASPDGSGNFIIGNPGEDLSGAIRDLQDQIAHTTDPTQLAALQYKLQQTRGLTTLPKPRRDYDALVLTAQKRLTRHFVMLASYTYARTLGNYGGMFDPVFGSKPNTSYLYDYRETMVNTDGALPSDRPHNLKLSVGWVQPVLRRNTLNLGLAFFASSGAPIDVRGMDPHYTSGIVFILPRGSGGRLPTVSSVSLHAGFARQVDDRVRVEAYADVFNAFNQQAVTRVDTLYTTDTVNPILNGTPQDLMHLRTIDGNPVTLNPNYGQPTAYQSPLSLRVGVRASF